MAPIPRLFLQKGAFYDPHTSEWYVVVPPATGLSFWRLARFSRLKQLTDTFLLDEGATAHWVRGCLRLDDSHPDALELTAHALTVLAAMHENPRKEAANGN